jgi:drug/metabolite transporter (DMT)-like permease
MWVTLSLLTAFSIATSDALTKKVLRTRDEYFVAWIRLLFTLPVLVTSLFFIEIPPLDRTFWLATVCALPLEITAMILYTKALKVSPLSVTLPFLALTPLFLIVTSNLILGESVSISGAAGILLMAAGAYTLNLHKARHAFLAPIRAIFREKGSVMMIGVAFIYSITASLGKMAIEHSSPIFFGCFYFILVTILFTPIAIKMNKGNLSFRKKDIIPFASIGFTYSIMIICHMLAMSLVNVAYMISIKRTSILFSIIYGHFLFREERIAEKAVGSIIMLAGFILIVIWN